MSERKDYEMTPAQLDTILDACKPGPLIALHCGEPRSAQERANDAWQRLGAEMGFRHMTVKPIPGKGTRSFTAVEAVAHE